MQLKLELIYKLIVRGLFEVQNAEEAQIPIDNSAGLICTILKLRYSNWRDQYFKCLSGLSDGR